MDIIVLGTGGVGGYYGGLLALHGHQVTFIARGPHLQAISQAGLQVKSVHGDFTIHPARAMADPAPLGPVDLVLVCTKTYSTQAGIQLLRSNIGPRTVVVSLQNGVEAAEAIGAIVGMQYMLAGATWLSSSVESPGVIRQVSQFRRVAIGELDGSITPRLQEVARAFEPTGISIEVTDQIGKVLWTKFLFISAVSGIGSLTRLELGAFRAIPETRRLMTDLMREVDSVARARGILLDADVVEQTLAFVDSSAPHIRSSMQRDVESGNIFELEAIIGVIGRQGRLFGIPTPIADMLYAALLPVLVKAAG